MKLFFYKTLIVAVAFILVFKLTFGLVISNFELSYNHFQIKKTAKLLSKK